MGTEPNGEIGDDCLLCYAFDNTPKHIIMSITGIKTGGTWNPGDPHPPNGTQKLTQNAFNPCLWVITPPNRVFAVSTIIGTTQFSIQAFNPFMWIFKDLADQCATFASNQFDVPGGNKFYGGSIQLWTV